MISESPNMEEQIYEHGEYISNIQGTKNYQSNHM